MKRLLMAFVLLLSLTHCQEKDTPTSTNIVTTDIDNFWRAYDKITATKDTAQQLQYLQELYLELGSKGLDAIITTKRYSPEKYLAAINDYPKFWTSIRANTLRANEFRAALDHGIEQLRNLYPDLKPAKIYFTIGALGTNGTTKDSSVLIGSELAMADETTDASEFPSHYRAGRREYFDSNPIRNLVLLNIHEYVHTQQPPIAHNLLAYCVYEGVAEFVSVKATKKGSVVPAIAYGKSNDQVRQTFEREAFYDNNVKKWLWSDAENDFDTRDLGYYIGYQLCENYYEQADDKKAAIKEMIELDVSNIAQLDAFVDKANFFSKPIDTLRQEHFASAPTVTDILEFENGSKMVSPSIKTITLQFSEPLSSREGIGFGPLGKDFLPSMGQPTIWSDDGTSWSTPVSLEPNRHYQINVMSYFETSDERPLIPYLIEFWTGEQ